MHDRDYEMIAQQVHDLNEKVAALGARLTEIEQVNAALGTRLTEIEQVNAGLEKAAETTGRALKEISRHWDAVYEAMRRGVRS